MDPIQIFTFSPILIQRINREFGEFFSSDPLTEKIYRDEAYAIFLILKNATSLKSVEREIYKPTATMTEFRKRQLENRVMLRSYLLDFFCEEYLENAFQLQPGIFYEYFKNTSHRTPFPKFRCIRKIVPAVWEIEFVSKKNELCRIDFPLWIDMIIHKSTEQFFLGKNVYFLF